jgi:hypothetical protein
MGEVMKYVLIIIVMMEGKNGGAAIEHVPFETMQLCEIAKDKHSAWLDYENPKRTVDMIRSRCVQVRE